MPRGSRRRLRQARLNEQMRRRCEFESLEVRSMLSGDGLVEGVDFLRPSQMFARMAGQPITGATIITHGFQLGDRDGDSLLQLGEKIWFKVDALNGGAESSYLLDYDVRGQNTAGVFDLSQSRLPATGRLQPGHLTLVFDWAPESNEMSAGWGEAAGDALFNTVVGLGLVDLTNTTTTQPLHFIAHSFGTAVASGWGGWA
jgi:hypothetical protein